jgi:hypothetical protein
MTNTPVTDNVINPIKAAIKERHGIKNDSDITPKVCARIAAECSTALVNVISAETDLGSPIIMEFKGKDYDARKGLSDAMHIFDKAARSGRGYHFTRVR